METELGAFADIVFGTKLCKDSIKYIRSIGKRIYIYRATAKAFSSFFVFIFCSVFANTSLGTHMPCINHLIYLVGTSTKEVLHISIREILSP